MDTNPPSEIKPIREIGLLKWYKTVRPDELSLSLFKNSGKVLRLELKKLLGSV